MRFLLESSSALALLHKRDASILVSFHKNIFREANVAEVPEERLEKRWEVFIEEDVAFSDWEGESPANTAKAYIEEWCERWLARRYSEDDGTYRCRLTNYAEQALLFVVQHPTSTKRTFIGTESNFSEIWRALRWLPPKAKRFLALRTSGPSVAIPSAERNALRPADKGSVPDSANQLPVKSACH